jgi:peroxiredoxin Q/BCP
VACVGENLLFIYFLSKDNTPVYRSSLSFRDKYEDFKDLGAEVIGISSDGCFASKIQTAIQYLSFFYLMR